MCNDHSRGKQLIVTVITDRCDKERNIYDLLLILTVIVICVLSVLSGRRSFMIVGPVPAVRVVVPRVVSGVTMFR